MDFYGQAQVVFMWKSNDNEIICFLLEEVLNKVEEALEGWSGKKVKTWAPRMEAVNTNWESHRSEWFDAVLASIGPDAPVCCIQCEPEFV